MLPSASQMVVWCDTVVCHAGPHGPRVPTFPCTGRQPSHSDEYAADRTAKARLAPGARPYSPGRSGRSRRPPVVAACRSRLGACGAPYRLRSPVPAHPAHFSIAFSIMAGRLIVEVS
jgi:hypothetical protein